MDKKYLKEKKKENEKQRKKKENKNKKINVSQYFFCTVKRHIVARAWSLLLWSQDTTPAAGWADGYALRQINTVR